MSCTNTPLALRRLSLQREQARVVVDGAGRSALLDVVTSANAAAGAAAFVEGPPAGLLVGSLLRDASPALFFIVSAWEAGTAAR